MAERIQHLFIVRIWQEPSASAPPGQWRGSAEHVPTGQRFYFSTIEELNRSILGQMNKAAIDSFAQSVQGAKAEEKHTHDAGHSSPPLLSEDQMALLQESFRQATLSTESFAHRFYHRLFEIEPSIRPLFPADLTDQEQKFVTMLAVLVGEIGNADRLRALLTDLGRRHVGYGTRNEHYGAVGAVLVWTLSDLLGDDFTPAVEEAWLAAYRVIAAAMKSTTGA